MPFGFGTVCRIIGLYSKGVEKKDKRFIKNICIENNGTLDKLRAYREGQALTFVHTGGTTGVPKGVELSHDT